MNESTTLGGVYMGAPAPTFRERGYISHSGLDYFCCPRCGGQSFSRCIQSDSTDETRTFEYRCVMCGQPMGLTVIRD